PFTGHLTGRRPPVPCRRSVSPRLLGLHRTCGILEEHEILGLLAEDPAGFVPELPRFTVRALLVLVAIRRKALVQHHGLVPAAELVRQLLCVGTAHAPGDDTINVQHRSTPPVVQVENGKRGRTSTRVLSSRWCAARSHQGRCDGAWQRQTSARAYPPRANDV